MVQNQRMDADRDQGAAQGLDESCVHEDMRDGVISNWFKAAFVGTVILAGVTLIYAPRSDEGFLGIPVDRWLTAGFWVALGFGTWRRSRICAVALLVAFAASLVLLMFRFGAWTAINIPNMGALFLFYKAFRASSERPLPVTVEADS